MCNSYIVLILLFLSAYNTSLIYCPVIWCLHINKRRPCSSTLSGHPSFSFHNSCAFKRGRLLARRTRLGLRLYDYHLSASLSPSLSLSPSSSLYLSVYLSATEQFCEMFRNKICTVPNEAILRGLLKKCRFGAQNNEFLFE